MKNEDIPKPAPSAVERWRNRVSDLQSAETSARNNVVLGTEALASARARHAQIAGALAEARSALADLEKTTS